MTRKSPGFRGRDAAQGQHAAPDALIRHVLIYRRIYANPTQSAPCPIDVTKMLARFGRGSLDESSKTRPGTTPEIGSTPLGKTESAMTKHQLLWCLGVVALLIGVSRTACADERPAPKKVVTIEGITEYHLDNGL